MKLKKSERIIVTTNTSLMHNYFLTLWLLISFLSYGQNSTEKTIPQLLGNDPNINLSQNGLLPEAERAFQKMENAALKAGIHLKIVSSYRSYSDQKRIWNRKYSAFTKEGLSPEDAIRKIITYSTLPGTSRHHWGTDIDLIDSVPKIEGDVLLAEHFESGKYQKLYQWLKLHAASFGFEIVYPNEKNRKGFLYEPWHYSFADLSKSFLTQYINKNALHMIAKDTTLLGYQFITKDFLDQYKAENILGISARLIPANVH